MKFVSQQAHVLTTLVFVVFVASFKRGEILPMLPLFIYPAAMMFMSGVFLLPWKRMLMVSPVVLTLGLFGSWATFGSLVVRFTLSVSALLILVEITGFSGFCSALSCLKVPRVMITQLLLMHRYSFLLSDEVRRLRCAYSLRAPHSPKNKKISLRVFGSMSGNLLLRTFDRAETVHQAMLCRGFCGQLEKREKWKKFDLLYILFWIGVFLIVRNFHF